MPMNKRADKVLVEKNATPRKAEARTAGEERRGGKSQINDENAIKKSLKLFFPGTFEHHRRALACFKTKSCHHHYQAKGRKVQHIRLYF